MLQACNESLQDARKQNEVADYIKSQQSDLIKAQSERMVELEKKQDSILQSPILWFAAGMIVTGFTVHMVK